MVFRPFPILTLIAVPALVTLVWLGVWQAQRAEWKAGLIEQFERSAIAEPLAPETLCTADPVGKVIAPPDAGGETLRLFGHNAAGDAGWRLLRAARFSCGAVLVEAGFEAVDTGAGLPPKTTPATRYFVEPWPEKPWMAAENSPAKNEWHWFDAPLMAAALKAAPLNAALIVTPLAGKPDFLTRTPPEGHIGYAVTWFGMAAAFAVIYALFHARAGRLRFRKGKAEE